MSEMQSCQGGCHCGAVRYEASADISKAMECNCSHCSKKGFLLAFTPAENFQLLQGEDKLTEYRFNKKHISHVFCSQCGVQSFGKGVGPGGAEMAMLNVRCLDGIDVSKITISQIDGKSL